MNKYVALLIAGFAILTASCSISDNSVNSNESNKTFKVQFLNIDDTTQKIGIIKVDTTGASWVDNSFNYVGDTIVWINLKSKQTSDTITFNSNVYYRYYLQGKQDCSPGIYCSHMFTNGPIRFLASDSTFYLIRISKGQLIDELPFYSN